jgi:hypothetical protein
MGYGGTKEYVQALRDIVVANMIEKPGTVDTLAHVALAGALLLISMGRGRRPVCPSAATQTRSVGSSLPLPRSPGDREPVTRSRLG